MTDRPWTKLLLPVLLVAIAVIIRILIPALKETPYVIFYPAVIISALYSGVRLGLFSTALSAIAVSIAFGPGGSLQIDIPGHAAGIISFLAGNIIIIGIINRLRRSKERTIEESQKLKTSEQRLKEEVEDRKRSEEALRESREDMARAQAVGNIGSWRLDVQKNILTWSDENHRIFGIPKGTPLTYETFLSTIHPDDRDYVDAKWKAGLRGEPYDIEHRLVANGQTRWVREKAYLEFDAQGALLGGFGITQDITERKKGEEEIKKINEELEARVRERTSELLRLNRELEAEIAERIRAEDYVMAERERFNQLLETIPAYLVLLTPDYHVAFANSYFWERFGEAHGRRCFEYLFNRSEPCEVCETYKVLKTGEPHHWEWTGPDNRNYDVYDYPFLDNDGSTLILEMGIDITERKQAEEKLVVFKNLINQSSDSIFVVDPETAGILEINDSACTNLGYSRKELLNIRVTDFAGKQRDFSTWRTYAEKIKEKGDIIVEDSLMRKDGTVFPVEVSVRHISQKEKDYHIAIVRDITERKEIESRLNVSNAFLKFFSQTSSRNEYLDSAVKLIKEWGGCRCAGIRMLDTQGNIPYESYTGFSKEFWEMENFLSINQDQCACIRVIAERPENQDSPNMTGHGSFCTNNILEFVNSLSDEEKARFRGTCAKKGFRSVGIIPIKYGEKMLGAIHLADERADMLHLKLAESLEAITPLIGEAIHRFDIEDEVRRSNELLEKVFSNIHVLIAYMDTEFNFIRVNPLYAEADGREPEFFIGKNHFAFYPNKENEGIFKKVVATGEPYYAYAKPFEYAENPERGITYWDWSLQPVKDSSGAVQGLVLSLINVTEKVRLEADTMQAAHLASLGELAAGVAHEINNPLNGIINYAQMLVNKINKETRENEIAYRIIKEGDRIANIVRSLLSFARKRTEEKSVFDIAAILEDSIMLTEAQLLKENINLKINMPMDLPQIIANSQQIQQVFLNLINNARYALNQKYPGVDDNKIIEITGERTIIDSHIYARIIFDDRGTGIPSNLIEKVLNPFFSTKPSGRGTGLGLSISHGIIRDHGGNLKIESVEGEFTRIIIDLPAAAVRNKR